MNDYVVIGHRLDEAIEIKHIASHEAESFVPVHKMFLHVRMYNFQVVVPILSIP